MDTPFGSIPDRYGQLSMAEAHEYLTARQISRRRLIRGAAVAAAGAWAGPSLLRAPARAAVAPAGVHLTYGNDPGSVMTVSWSTAEDVAQPALDIGLDGGFGRVVPAETRTVAGTATRYHHAVVTGLEPGRAYRYRVRHDGGTGPEATLTTAPPPAAAGPFTFTAFGDQGVGAGGAATTARALAQSPAFHLHAGDLCYAYSSGNGTAGPTDQAVWDRWFAQAAPLASRAPWMPAVGNHEMEVGYGPQGYGGILARFTLPGGGPTPVVNAFRYGNVAVVSLDGNDASNELAANRGYSAGAQDTWLDATLAGLRADPSVDFIVAQFHHCSYCTNAVHASDGGVRDRWSPLFDKHTVDLVINGHNHCYERTHPIRAGVPTAEVPSGGTVDSRTQGTTYITAGGGGQTAYQATLHPLSYVTIDGGVRLPETATWSAARYLDLSLLAIDVAPPGAGGVATMRIRALRPDGSLVEAITITRTRAAAGTAGVTSSAGAAGSGAASGAAQVAARAAGPEDALAATGGGAGVPLVAGGALVAAVALRHASRAGSGSGASS